MALHSNVQYSRLVLFISLIEAAPTLAVTGGCSRTGPPVTRTWEQQEVHGRIITGFASIHTGDLHSWIDY